MELDKQKLVVDYITLTKNDGTVEDAINIAKSVIEENGGCNKFTGYYIQRQLQKDILVLMYGYDASNRNGISEKITLEENEVDYVDMCMKLYILDNRKHKRQKKISFIERRNSKV